MNAKSKITLIAIALVGATLCAILLNSCKRDNVPYDTKHITAFHQATASNEVLNIESDDLALYVDYSNCIATGMTSPFYQKMVSPLTAATDDFYSIKGDEITEEDGASVYELLNNVTEVNYAAIDKAVKKMAERDGESVLLTDGELFTQTSTKNNPNNPYMHAAFKEWLMKGHDIHIIAEPYVENFKGTAFNKKRFYIIFTDDRLEGNIYDRIKEVVDFEQFPQVDEFHLSGNYPWLLPIDGKSSHVNSITGADVKAYGAFEVQDWQVDWKNIINLILNAYDDQGNPLPNGDKLISGLKVNKNAFGCYRISDIAVRVTNINDDYFDLYNRVEGGENVSQMSLTGQPIEHFIIVDQDEFKRHGNVELYFDVENFAPNGDLNGNPFNFFKIEILVNKLDNILGNSIEMFNFDSIVNPGQTNESVSESLKNCVFDPDLITMLQGKVLYTIYVKSEKY